MVGSRCTVEGYGTAATRPDSSSKTQSDILRAFMNCMRGYNLAGGGELEVVPRDEVGGWRESGEELSLPEILGGNRSL